VVILLNSSPEPGIPDCSAHTPGDSVQTLCSDGLTVLRICRPQVRNALDVGSLEALGAAIAGSAAAGARLLIIEGADGNFSAGADLKALAAGEPGYQERLTAAGQAVFSQLETCGMLTIASIDGYCLGGGLELALACDLRVATADGVFGLPEVRLGGIPSWGGTQRLPRLIGLSRAKQLMLLGGRHSAREAEQWGLVNHLAEGAAAAWDYLVGLGSAMSGVQPGPFAAIKSLLHRSAELSLAEGLRAEAAADRAVGGAVATAWAGGQREGRP
jgi:enoyl-CoA hydratase